MRSEYLAMNSSAVAEPYPLALCTPHHRNVVDTIPLQSGTVSSVLDIRFAAASKSCLVCYLLQFHPVEGSLYEVLIAVRYIPILYPAVSGASTGKAS